MHNPRAIVGKAWMDRCYLESAEAASQYVGKNVMSCRYAPIAERPSAFSGALARLLATIIVWCRTYPRLSYRARLQEATSGKIPHLI